MGCRGFVAAQDGLGQEGVRAELFDQLVPSSVPFSRYHEWRQRFPIADGPPATALCGCRDGWAGAINDT